MSTNSITRIKPVTETLVSRMNAAGILARRKLAERVGPDAMSRGTGRMKTDGSRMTLGELAFVEAFDTYGLAHGVANPESYRAI